MAKPKKYARPFALYMQRASGYAYIASYATLDAALDRCDLIHDWELAPNEWTEGAEDLFRIVDMRNLAVYAWLPRAPQYEGRSELLGYRESSSKDWDGSYFIALNVREQ